ncbi:transient receptor potential cation channel subfamily A member 1-like [Branchiostoma floridae x Branchiostoma belcheri]
MAKNVNEALLYAAESGSLEGVEAALDAGADINYNQQGCEITGTGTALYIASCCGYVDIVRLLLSKGASLTKRTTATSLAPLHGAASKGRIEVVELLVQHGATLDIKDLFQRTPLMIACVFKQVCTVRQLIELGARVDLTDSCNQTAQRYCEMEGMEVCPCGRKLMIDMIQYAKKTKLLVCCNPVCGKPGFRSTLKLCAQCKLTRYCSRDCQKQHWSVGHKKSCGQDAYTGNEPSNFEKTVLLMTGGTLLKLAENYRDQIENMIETS